MDDFPEFSAIKIVSGAKSSVLLRNALKFSTEKRFKRGFSSGVVSFIERFLVFEKSISKGQP
ncbi:MAG: hypothetical protein DRR19_00505 [Candidatus Parabeggiatoa sp. nov. 1]|nr:MAG: hypothetical protein DRR19_00505 [Gammaproteobacteria bacterium]